MRASATLQRWLRTLVLLWLLWSFFAAPATPPIRSRRRDDAEPPPDDGGPRRARVRQAARARRPSAQAARFAGGRSLKRAARRRA